MKKHDFEHSEELSPINIANPKLEMHTPHQDVNHDSGLNGVPYCGNFVATSALKDSVLKA